MASAIGPFHFKFEMHIRKSSKFKVSDEIMPKTKKEAYHSNFTKTSPLLFILNIFIF